MAVEKISLGINLRKNKISGSAGYGKYYPEVDTQKTLSLRFAPHYCSSRHGGTDRTGNDELHGLWPILNYELNELHEFI